MNYDRYARNLMKQGESITAGYPAPTECQLRKERMNNAG